MEVSSPAATYFRTMREAYASRYRQGADVWTNQAEMRIFPALVQGRLKLGPNTRALDIGCGAGADGLAMARLYGHVLGIDIISHPDWPTADAQPNLELACVAFLDLDAPSGSFDLITDNGCFHHQHPDDRAEYLVAIARLLARGGYVVFSTFKGDAATSNYDTEGRLHAYFGDVELDALLAAAELTPIDRIDVHRAKFGDYYRLSFARR